MNTIDWQIKNMSCASCVATIRNLLEKKGQQNIKINLLDGRLSFAHQNTITLNDIKKEIESLGYEVVYIEPAQAPQEHLHRSKFLIRFVISIVFSLPLFLHMFLHIALLHNPWIQLGLTLPIYTLGIMSFGKSALKSVINNSPNMNVLIVLGATAALAYSIVGCLIFENLEYLFFETTASIFTLVFLGNWLEEKSLQATQKEIKKIIKSMPSKANLIVQIDGQEQIKAVPIKDLKMTQQVLVRVGEQVPADAKIIWGTGKFDESLISGESMPVNKNIGDYIIGGSIMEGGNIKATITNVGEQSVLGQIIKNVRSAELDKPEIQNLADKISAVFVPIVIFFSGMTFVINFYFVDNSLTTSLMRAIAVLVIACPCALGLATPAAISIGLGRGARKGILYKKAKNLEIFKTIQQIAFDKTGILTTGDFRITEIETKNIEIDTFKNIVGSIAIHSTHPITSSITKNFIMTNTIQFKKVEEIKGIGIKASTHDGDEYILGSHKIIAHLHDIPQDKNLYLLHNQKLLGWIDLQDTIRSEAKEVLDYFRKKNITIYMISGDMYSKCKYVAEQLGISNFYAEHTPEMKQELIKKLQKQSPIAMVGDGINDSPALAQANIGITINGASHISIEAASVILMQPSLAQLPNALILGNHTYQTIKENLAWAFAYNILALPLAAMGVLSPTFSALIMGGSDVILALNSTRLLLKKLK